MILAPRGPRSVLITGHDWVLQTSIFVEFPKVLQSLPPFDGAGWSHVRYLGCKI